MEEREDQIDRLDFIRNQMNLLTLDVKKKIREVTEEVANKVGNSNSVIKKWNRNIFHNAKNVIPVTYTEYFGVFFQFEFLSG